MTRIRAVIGFMIVSVFALALLHTGSAADQEPKDRQRPPITTTTTEAPTTTIAPSTTTTTTTVRVVQKAQASAPEVRAVIAGPSGGGDVFDALARCESGMHNDTGGPYFGYFQFLPSTWHSMGLSGMPYDYDYATQKDAAQRLVARSGWSQFPQCSRKLGMR